MARCVFLKPGSSRYPLGRQEPDLASWRLVSASEVLCSRRCRWRAAALRVAAAAATLTLSRSRASLMRCNDSSATRSLCCVFLCVFYANMSTSECLIMRLKVAFAQAAYVESCGFCNDVQHAKVAASILDVNTLCSSQAQLRWTVTPRLIILGLCMQHLGAHVKVDCVYCASHSAAESPGRYPCALVLWRQSRPDQMPLPLQMFCTHF